MRLATIGAMALLTLPAAAQSNMIGVGSILCRDLVRNQSDQTPDAMLIAWVGGFLTGINMSAIANGGRGVDLSGLSLHPLDGLAWAALATP